MAYSIEYRKRAVAYKQAGHTFTRLREVFGIHNQTYYQWKKRLESGYYQTKIVRERKRKINKDTLRQAVEENPGAYPRELAEQFNCTDVAVFYALKKMKITRKKDLYL